MSNQKAKTLLEAFVKNATLEGSIIDTSTLDFDAFHKILDEKIYDDGIDYGLLWSVCINNLFKYHDNENKDRKFTDEERHDFVKRVNKFLSSVPYEYDFYFRLPEQYPLTSERISKKISVIKADQKLIDEQEKINPPSDFDRLVRSTRQKDNYRLLTLDRYYLKIEDKGLVASGKEAFLESAYSPDRIFGVYLAVHLITGNLATTKLARDNASPHIYDKSGTFRATFVSPVKSSKAEHLEFLDNKDVTKMANKVFLKLISHQADKDLESARIQLCNSMYWYLEFLNSEEASLQLVFLVSALDSLFPPRMHSVFKNKQITPTVIQKAPLIAEMTSKSQSEYQEFLRTLENLFEARNNVIHGKVEIHGYRKSSKKENNKMIELIELSEEIYTTYIKKRIAKFL